MEEQQLLSQLETSNSLKAIYDMLNAYDAIGDIEVCFESFDETASSISLFSQQGAVYLKKFITGGYRGLIPFYIVYRSTPKTDTQKLNKIEYLNDLGKWVCEPLNYPNVSDIEVEKIEQTSVPFKDDSDGAGECDYIVTFEMTYRKDE